MWHKCQSTLWICRNMNFICCAWRQAKGVRKRQWANCLHRVATWGKWTFCLSKTFQRLEFPWHDCVSISTIWLEFGKDCFKIRLQTYLRLLYISYSPCFLINPISGCVFASLRWKFLLPQLGQSAANRESSTLSYPTPVHKSDSLSKVKAKWEDLKDF